MASSNASQPESLAVGPVRVAAVAAAPGPLLAAAFVLLLAQPAAAAGPAEEPARVPPANSSAPSGAAAQADDAPAPLPAGSPEDLSALLRGMRSTSGVVAQFTETKELALLSQPLQATGTIYFLPPGRLVRVVASPGKSRLVVDGDKVRFEEETGNRSFDLSASPIARQLIDSFVVLFNGDEARLKELYDVEFAGDQKQWLLHLEPRSRALGRMIESFDLRGAGPKIDVMVALEPDGDRTLTRFGQTDARHVFSTEEIAALFEAPGP